VFSLWLVMIFLGLVHSIALNMFGSTVTVYYIVSMDHWCYRTAFILLLPTLFGICWDECKPHNTDLEAAHKYSSPV